jgi:hypothetical protein
MTVHTLDKRCLGNQTAKFMQAQAHNQTVSNSSNDHVSVSSVLPLDRTVNPMNPMNPMFENLVNAQFLNANKSLRDGKPMPLGSSPKIQNHACYSNNDAGNMYTTPESAKTFLSHLGDCVPFIEHFPDLQYNVMKLCTNPAESDPVKIANVLEGYFELTEQPISPPIGQILKKIKTLRSPEDMNLCLSLAATVLYICSERKIFLKLNEEQTDYFLNERTKYEKQLIYLSGEAQRVYFTCGQLYKALVSALALLNMSESLDTATLERVREVLMSVKNLEPSLAFA